MAGLRLFTSNKLEILAQKLAEALSEPLPSPLESEVIVVQSRGMERWVSMELARRHGVSANCRFPFPNAFVHEVFRKTLPQLPDHPAFDPKILTFRIMQLLPACAHGRGFESLRMYLGEAGDDLKRLQVSERIADTFDQYLLYRPDMVFQWEKGEENHWQAQLFRALIKGSGNRHRAALGKEFLKRVKKSSAPIAGLPRRISVFGISALPRFHMEIFSGLSRYARVNLFLMNPCREYWGDILSERELIKRAKRQPGGDLSMEELHLEKGNSLLGSMGALGRDFFDLVNEFDCEERPVFEDPETGTLLSSLQSDILNLRDAPQQPDQKARVHAHDRSIHIHSCHSPMREMEILYDQLLRMFEEDPNLRPGDILVMTPDIESHAPYIQAVFDLPAHDPRRIPFSIADQSIRKESDIADAFLAILDLVGGPFGASQVMAVLESTAVRRRFDLDETDLDLARKWVIHTRIRRGIDGQSPGPPDRPSFPENTWRSGLERVLLGYAMTGEGERIFGAILPYDHLEGAEVQALGRFFQFAERLFTEVPLLGRSRTLDDWTTTLTELLEGFFMPDEDSEREMQALRGAFRELEDLGDLAGFREKIGIQALKWRLAGSLEKKGFGFGFITGGVTFCAMLPMRSIPFKIICLTGMNSDAYPRQSRPLGFDLMARRPRPGDRSRRHDDRYLFLEALLSARKKLYISYVGQSIMDNSPIPPSVLVSELLDYMDQGFESPGGPIPDHLVTRHRLQGFSPEYFKGHDRLFSFSGETLEAARSLLKDRDQSGPFISRGLPPGPADMKTLDLEDLCRFFQNPARFLLEKRLGLYLGRKRPLLEDQESFDLKDLERYVMGEKLLKWRLRGRDPKGFFRLARASGSLPHGTVGECLLETLSRDIEAFASKTETYLQGAQLEPLGIDLTVSDFRITGRINGLFPQRLILYRHARVRPYDLLRLWIHHLALNMAGAGGYPRTSMFAALAPEGREPQWKAWAFPPLHQAETILEDLLETYWQGLMRPLHFSPKTSWEYASHVHGKGKPREEALKKALKTWEGSEYSMGEGEDGYYRLCFEEGAPLDREFETRASEILRPLLENVLEI
ncbi:MAG: exodeoxyribonuclease V subunit gamma [Deltaproteobacteria bacterium]|nr:exodeoxyribonuclease V subunit gamma [Deltaproteobacteria bacterium]